MADVTVKTIDEFDVAFGGAMKLVRHGLGVQAFGLQVEDFPPNADQYPEHDHSHDSQEEVFIVMEGAVTLQAGGEEHELRPGAFARVGPGEKRKLVTGKEGARVIAIGGVPGKAYEIPPFTLPQEAQQA
jgi:quercetin dioxygenase-like cupin family protein